MKKRFHIALFAVSRKRDSPPQRDKELWRQMATLSVRCCRWGQTPYEGIICEYM
ncbi:MAG: hypothetical protein KBI46_11585 [Phycisphaerae bacterium]|nr:hypothetical protein [Phycisphaerae bacterium]